MREEGGGDWGSDILALHVKRVLLYYCHLELKLQHKSSWNIKCVLSSSPHCAKVLVQYNIICGCGATDFWPHPTTVQPLPTWDMVREGSEMLLLTIVLKKKGGDFFNDNNDIFLLSTNLTVCVSKAWYILLLSSVVDLHCCSDTILNTSHITFPSLWRVWWC